MAKTKAEDLPTLDDFTESKLASTKDVNLEVEEEEEEIDPPDPDTTPVGKKQEKKTTPAPVVKPTEKKQEGKKSATTKPVAPVQKEEEEEEEEEDPNNPKNKEEEEEEGNFWTDVEKITGIELHVDYGDVDPETAQGAAIREQALAEFVVENYIKTLQEKFPRAYKILEHEANGGKIEDLITPQYVDYSKIELKLENVEQQKAILMDFYIKDKGFDEKKAKRMVEADEDSDEGLFGQAQDALKSKVEAQKLREEQITKDAKLKQQAREAQDSQFLGSVKQVIAGGKVGNFNIITKKDKEEFYSFVENSLQRNGDDGYVAVVPVGKDNVAGVLQQLYFGYKNGDLEGFIQRTAESVNVKRLQRKVKIAEKITSAGEDKQNPNKQLPTFADFMEK